jgi:hypothetical protein
MLPAEDERVVTRDAHSHASQGQTAGPAQTQEPSSKGFRVARSANQASSRLSSRSGLSGSPGADARRPRMRAASDSSHRRTRAGSPDSQALKKPGSLKICRPATIKSWASGVKVITPCPVAELCSIDSITPAARSCSTEWRKCGSKPPGPKATPSARPATASSEAGRRSDVWCPLRAFTWPHGPARVLAHAATVAWLLPNHRQSRRPNVRRSPPNARSP